MGLGRLSKGERISGISAIPLYVFMSFDWFGIEAVNNPNLLFLALLTLGGSTIRKRIASSHGNVRSVVATPFDFQPAPRFPASRRLRQ